MGMFTSYAAILGDIMKGQLQMQNSEQLTQNTEKTALIIKTKSWAMPKMEIIPFNKTAHAPPKSNPGPDASSLSS